MKNIFVLPTDQPIRFCENVRGKLSFTDLPFEVGGVNCNQHIYITCDENVVDRDWVYYENGDLKGIHKVVNGKIPKTMILKKIILTSNADLVDDGVQSVDSYFLEWFVNNHTCKFVEVKKNYKNWYVSGSLAPDLKLIYRIILPQEEIEEEVECNNCGCLMSLLPDNSIYVCTNSECTSCNEEFEEDKEDFKEPKQEIPKRTFTEEEVLAIIKVSCEQGMYIQRTINDKVNIPYFRIKEFQKQVLDNYKNK